MTSEERLRELLEYLLSIEEKGKALYEDYLARVRDPEIVQKLSEVHAEETGHVRIAKELLRILKKYERVKDKETASSKFHFSLIWLYTFLGMLLGLGAPVGGLTFRFFLRFQPDMHHWLEGEWAQFGWFYSYMTLGAVMAFSGAGAAAGWVHERLRDKARNLTAKARVLEDVAVKDPLTELFNFGYIRERLSIEMERSKRFQTPLSCLMLDIDNLKTLNDNHGHPAGDAVLRRVAQLIQHEVRVIDTVTRYGGDEFFLILPATSATGASALADRIREKIRNERISFEGNSLGTTVSIGIAVYPTPSVTDVDALVRMADQALYEAKRCGRDRVQPAASSVLAAQKKGGGCK